MWIFTTIGFFSIVQKPRTSLLTVRARVASDLDNLRKQFMPTLSVTTTKGGTDYPYRATISHADFAAGLAKLGSEIDYGNFKDEVANRMGEERSNLYLKVWHEMRKLEDSLPLAVQSTVSRKSRFLGAVLGLAAGDAVGTTVEFKPRGSFSPVTDMVGGGPFKLLPGQWTDDTSMALCLGQSLLDKHGFDPMDQLRKYVQWWQHGYMSSTDDCFDIGGTTCAALSRFTKQEQPWCGSTDSQKAGNGSIMRLAPVPMYFAFDPKQALEHCANSSRTTHGALTAVDGCRYLGALLLGALAGEKKDVLLGDHYSPVPGYWQKQPLVQEIAQIAGGSFWTKSEREIKGSGYVAQSLEAALWCLAHTGSFEEGCLKAVNLGDDADTTAAVYGQLAGALYGAEAIPGRWRSHLAKGDLLEQIALGLYRSGSRPHANCYWVEPDRLMAGEYPGAKSDSEAADKVRRTIESGITFFLDLTEAGEHGLKPYKQFLPAVGLNGLPVVHHRIAVQDVSVPEKAVMKEILQVMEKALTDGHIVYVHCWGGVGRTGTAVGCWLRRQGFSGKEALEQVTRFWAEFSESKRQRKPKSPENHEPKCVCSLAGLVSIALLSRFHRGSKGPDLGCS